MSFWDDIGLISGTEFKKLLHEMEMRMAAREDAAYADLTATIETVKEGWAALQAENANLKGQLESAQVDFQAQLDADSEADATKVEAADQALKDIVTPPVTEEPAPPVEEPPAEPTPGDGL